MKDFIEQAIVAVLIVVSFILAASVVIAVLMAPFVLAARFWEWVT